MDPKIIKTAKEVPARLKDIVDSMFEESKPTLRTGVSGLRQALGRIESYLEQVEQEHLGSTPTRAKKRTGKEKATAKKKSARKKAKKTGKQFPISKFVLDTLANGKKPMKAADIAAKLSEAAPGKHADASAATYKTLGRLKSQGKVKRTKAGWKVA